MKFVIEVDGIDGNFHYFKDRGSKSSSKVTRHLELATTFENLGQMVNTLMAQSGRLPFCRPEAHSVRLVMVKEKLSRGDVLFGEIHEEEIERL